MNRQPRNKVDCRDGDEKFDKRGWYDGRTCYEERECYHRCDRRDESTRFNLKLEILDFEGKMQPDDFLD